MTGTNGDSTAWPEWLTPESTAIHRAFENEIKRALQHCYDSADASGYDWTTEGWISCSASNIVGLLARLGCPPPPVGEVEPLPMPDGQEYAPEDWQECSRCGGSGEEPTALNASPTESP